MYALLLYSGNDDALALAIAAGGGKWPFVREMNAEAKTLGLRDTHFVSPSGVVDLDNYSSAWDLAALTRVAMRNPRFRTIVATRVKHVPWTAPTYSKIYVNNNRLIGVYPGATGVKTGYTHKAGPCLVASATRGRRLAHRGRARLERHVHRREAHARLRLRDAQRVAGAAGTTPA